MIRKNLGRKIAFSCGFLFVFVFFSAYFYSSRSIEKQALSQLEKTMTQRAWLMTQILGPELFKKEHQAALYARVRELGSVTGVRVTLIGLDGRVLADSEVPFERLAEVENHKYRVEVRDALAAGLGKNVHQSQTVNVKMLYVAVPLKINNEPVCVMRISIPLHAVDEMVGTLKWPLGASSAAGILAVVLFSVLMSRSLTTRIGKLTEMASLYARGDLSRKVAIRSGDELEILARTMNQMAGALQERIRDLEKEKTKFAAVLAHLSDGVLAVDRENRILVANPSAEKIFGISARAVYGRSFIEAVRNKKLDDLLIRAIKEQRLLLDEIDWPQVETKILRAAALGISNTEEGVAGILVITDMTEIRRLENLRREFVANVSHELRTPLTSIRGFIETLLTGGVLDSEKGKEFLKIMEEDAARLNRLIDDLLELSRIEAEESTMQPERLSVEEEIQKTLKLFEPKIVGKKIRVQTNRRTDREVFVMAEPGAFQQVLVNLLDNAIKYNRPEGEVVIETRIDGQEAVISIRDTGCGIPPESISRIFERFYCVDKARSRELGGTGLGLSIVKHIIDAHGGKVSCESWPGRGSCFSITLPVSV